MKTHWRMRWDGRPGLVTSSTRGRVGGFWVLPRRGGLGALTAGIAQLIDGYARGGIVPRADTDRAMAAYRTLVKADLETDAVERGDASARATAESALRTARASWSAITSKHPAFGARVVHRLMTEESAIRIRLNAALARLAPAERPSPVALPAPGTLAVPAPDQAVIVRMEALLAQARALAARGADFMLPASQKAGEAAHLLLSLSSDAGRARGNELLEQARRLRIPFTREDALKAAKEGALEGLCRLVSDRLPLSWAVECPGGRLTAAGRLALWGGVALVALAVVRPYVAPITRRL